MRYKVVCVKEFKGIRSDGQRFTSPLPVKDAIYTVIGERVDGMGIMALLLAELPSRAGYNSDHFRPLEPDDLQWESLEEVLEGGGLEKVTVGTGLAEASSTRSARGSRSSGT